MGGNVNIGIKLPDPLKVHQKGGIPDPLQLFGNNEDTALPDPLNVHKSKEEGGMGMPDPLGLFGKPKAPQVPALTQAPAPGPASPQDPRAQQAGAQQRKRAQAGQGRNDTVKTGPSGLGEVPEQNKNRKELLGY